MKLHLDLESVEDYRTFLKIKSLPRYAFHGREAVVPDEYASFLGVKPKKSKASQYEPIDGLFDYQEAITRLAIRKQKFAVFAQCGLGKSLILLEFARHVSDCIRRKECVLIVSPLMVVRQTLAEAARFYGDSLPIVQLRANEIGKWLKDGNGKIGITNYEAITDDLEPGRLAGLILDESSMLKSHYGKWGTKLIELGKGLAWKLCLTGTPAPNDRIEYANHAVFLDAYPTVNSFLARFFVNRGQTQERWSLKPHALKPFYIALSHWCIFLENPATYGWKDNTANIPPIKVHIHDIDLTDAQQALAYKATGSLFSDQPGGITSRSVLSQLGKGSYRGEDVDSLKPAFIRNLVDGWSGTENTIIWCLFNREQELMEKTFPEAASIKGETAYEDRERMVENFKAGRTKVIISKGKILGLGLNLHVCTRMVFSGLQDSYETYWQCVKRANRIGSTVPLQVHIPVTEIERPMIETVLLKAKRVQADMEEQEMIFKTTGGCCDI